MSLKLYNTLTRRKEEFAPIDPANVRVYVCGPTVYDYAHIGNARPVIVFDVLFRLLRHVYGADHVTYVRNITDVDDKINDRAARDYPDLPLNEAIRKVTEATAAQFHADIKALGVLAPTHEPRATEHIDGMKAIIERLVAGGFAYVAEGHVLFSPAAMDAAGAAQGSPLPRYGALANRTLDEMIAGARVDVAPYKRDATDFVLWKPSKTGEPGWPSPAGIEGLGRPGWHIECSAMSQAFLGEVFDIHGGGIDLVFPHHENEIAQSTCAFGKGVMANVWMHNGFLQVEGEKMSKSLGNFVTINELLAVKTFGGRRWPGEVLRLAMLKTHYRQPIDWTLKALEEAERTLDRWYAAAAALAEADADPHPDLIAALQDDLNTAQALALLHGLFETAPACALASARLFGLMQASTDAWRKSKMEQVAITAEDIGVRIQARLEARRAKNFAESDRIRDELAAMGVQLKDGKDAATGEPTTTWEVKR
ncbi:cysteine--tRNA ligase [Alsobacter metallidurans]|uniref:Cysteine--tRNA ligase n=1 Tax=Alsobacter metallidurans TaxID=340221 RepID=A0A917I6R8_9HYPH|nr:cysteine--tRNA ligase [Alsobacter metallidurans]GGH15340.1 cysteine--tRNA ligase [Alsobacter metallidurans]